LAKCSLGLSKFIGNQTVHETKGQVWDIINKMILNNALGVGGPQKCIAYGV
jgi:hypothetical protein